MYTHICYALKHTCKGVKRKWQLFGFDSSRYAHAHVVGRNRQSAIDTHCMLCSLLKTHINITCSVVMVCYVCRYLHVYMYMYSTHRHRHAMHAALGHQSYIIEVELETGARVEGEAACSSPIIIHRRRKDPGPHCSNLRSWELLGGTTDI